MATDEQRRFLAEQYRLHAHTVYRRCLAMSGGDTDWAADVTQDVFVRLFEKGASLDQERSLSSWLLTVADRLCIDKLRRERSVWGRVQKALFARQRDRVAAAMSASARREESRLLRRAFSKLPEKELAVVVMKYIEDTPQLEIAKSLECSEGYVSQLLKRGLSRLRKYLEGDR